MSRQKEDSIFGIPENKCYLTQVVNESRKPGSPWQVDLLVSSGCLSSGRTVALSPRNGVA
jgi:hypothetical protein